MPAKTGAGNLPIKAGCRLKNNRIGKSDYTAGCASLSHFHDVHADKTDVNNLSVHPGHLYTIPDPDTVFADQEEVPGDRKNDILQSNGDSGGNEAGKSRDLSQLAGKGKGDDDRNHEPHHDPPQQHELVTATRIVHVFEN